MCNDNFIQVIIYLPEFFPTQKNDLADVHRNPLHNRGRPSLKTVVESLTKDNFYRNHRHKQKILCSSELCVSIENTSSNILIFRWR